MTRVTIIGAGVIGAAIAYELSLINGLDITLIDEKQPASGSTGAALGVLMAIISHKTKGRGWKLRQLSLERYTTLIPELEELTGKKIPVNHQGILMLRFPDDPRERWEKLQKFRHDHGYPLEIWDKKKLLKYCPQVQNNRVIGAIYSPQDIQIHPTILTESLILAASQNGVNCQFGVKVENITPTGINDSDNGQSYQIKTQYQTLETDWLIICAGLGSTPLIDHLQPMVKIKPVLGQALQIKLNHDLGDINFQPVITGEDVHIVPLKEQEYWVGATVEFPDEMGEVTAQTELLETVKKLAFSFCPNLEKGEIINTWSGKRPRPDGEAAPIIKEVPNYPHVLLATGHYRNGILLAPATALMIRDKIIDNN
ncbi:MULTISPECIES: NAD(P)/FAD-dependent oxidoreductase [Crocosphaera]|uniref:D-amino acid dehydrogenase small subunit n=2 Tax=Crocosphaera watsonii TaxID=263511 RepID=G5J7U4_CROWT|nr:MULTISPECIES: FAD-dependent oxidoreductase [Crocosphaera]EHJ11730.1 D-amino acid dehydrogenase small subunit [Crocosphaera watsonii WH 0003]MCH2247797.1 FAD-binding oxidoreductase [Crocosphaera sp.]NQZ62194.1 FAD-binding oxidoreductase [Crocosphaera sp.]CCQ54859.1 D-amino acid dehydrogenase small subunit [Crocosphaera watsonii WH 0005]